MLLIIIIVALIAILFSFINLRRFKKSDTQNIDNVQKYHENYKNRSRIMQDRRKPTGTNNYVTKYNSSVDYREKGS